MAIWDKLKHELDRAGKAAQGAIDEGKLRLEVFRVRQLADKSAQALGYAIFRARQAGNELDRDTYARLSSTLAAHEAEIVRLEQQAREEGADQPPAAGPDTSTTTEPPTSSEPPPAPGA